MPTANEKYDIRQAISDVVSHLMIDRRERRADLAPVFKTTARYVSRKMVDQFWSMDDLDILAEHYGYDPGDILQGYIHLSTVTQGQRNTMPMRSRITDAVQRLMVDHNESPEDLGRVFQINGKSFTEKLVNGRWMLDNLDVLAAHYGVQPHDIAAGYDHLTRVGTHVKTDD